MGNGGDWCRHDSKLAQEYNVVRNKEKGRIVSVQLNGFNKKPIKKTIKASIVKKIKQKRCVILHTSNPEVDHKNGRLDDPKSLNTSTQTMQDFQPLSKAANDAKRQHCKKCRKSGTRFDAASIGYPMSYYEGDAKHQGTCVGCYWYDPLEFRAKLKSI